ncbi:antitoxin Xre/MbcA/ParS toxin-binding domain-containing protein [Ferrovibrio sp.]|uniref:antitoxin Xre/MbcA/ParS toxin-binding domain-containing protein n=1 Tax=Ferrovibrio sp. TaxID=1917215 RepID=UPI0035AFAAD2|nr:DUF2384 domain-containing protein [Ferrovibrio sp.]
MEFLQETVDILGGRTVFHRRFDTPRQFDQAVRQGLPATSIASLQLGYGIRPQSILPDSTWKRRQKAGRLSPDESDKAVRIGHVLALARHVLGDDAMVRSFLNHPHPELAGDQPVNAILSEIGAREVEAILWRIFYGLPA